MKEPIRQHDSCDALNDPKSLMLLAQNSSMATTVATKSAPTVVQQTAKSKKFGKMLCHSKSMPVATIENESTEMLLRMFEHLVGSPPTSNKSGGAKLNNNSKQTNTMTQSSGCKAHRNKIVDKSAK